MPSYPKYSFEVFDAMQMREREDCCCWDRTYETELCVTCHRTCVRARSASLVFVIIECELERHWVNLMRYEWVKFLYFETWKRESIQILALPSRTLRTFSQAKPESSFLWFQIVMSSDTTLGSFARYEDGPFVRFLWRKYQTEMREDSLWVWSRNYRKREWIPQRPRPLFPSDRWIS